MAETVWGDELPAAAVMSCPDCGGILLIVLDPDDPDLPDEIETKIDGHVCPARPA